MISNADGSHDQMLVQQPELCTPGALDWPHMRPDGTPTALEPSTELRYVTPYTRYFGDAILPILLSYMITTRILCVV